MLSSRILKQISFQNTDSSDGSPVENILEHAMEGVVEIETDAGLHGSGFFFISACMVSPCHRRRRDHHQHSGTRLELSFGEEASHASDVSSIPHRPLQNQQVASALCS